MPLHFIPTPRPSALYIPFWLYSNIEDESFKALLTTFTFHSGYILIFTGLSSIILIFFFTFHSGYILINYTFITASVIILYIPFWLYSNDPVLLYDRTIFDTLHSILVIF